VKAEGCGNDGPMGSEENQQQVFLAAHSPWKSLRDSHIPAAPARDRSGKVEIQNQDFHFPTAHFILKNSKTKGDQSRPDTLILQAHL
jgi:hypothetical protein